MTTKKTWAGIPGNCDFCNAAITHEFVDGVVAGRSSWAVFCPTCHLEYGAGLGEGVGQLYQEQDGEFVKVRG